MNRPTRSVGLLLALAALVSLHAGCDEGLTVERGLDQPLRVAGGTFHEGALPGTLPTETGAAGGENGPAITALDNASSSLRPGQVGKALSGRASAETFSVGLRFADLGTGYWVVPVGNADPLQQGEVVWETFSELSPTTPPGLHPMRVVAIDGAGNAGPQREASFCVRDVVEDNGNACDPSVAPPYAVISLRWDSNVDLDLVVRVPSGKLVSPKAPTSVVAVDGVIPRESLSDPTVGVLDRDSNASCVIDGVRRETLIFQEKPPSGTYAIFASLPADCGESSVRFSVGAYLRRDLGNGNFTRERVFEQGGVLSAGDPLPIVPGTFIKDLVIP